MTNYKRPNLIVQFDIFFKFDKCATQSSWCMYIPEVLDWLEAKLTRLVTVDFQLLHFILVEVRCAFDHLTCDYVFPVWISFLRGALYARCISAL